jgi:hypothetical protein
MISRAPTSERFRHHDSAVQTFTTTDHATMKTLLFTLSLAIAVPAFAAAPLLKDDFSDPKLKERRAMRGDWKFANGTATCTQDDALYKKFKDHGPILFYDLAHTDATVRFSFKADGAKTLVFTANGEKGHIFRFVMSATGTSIRAFPPDAKAKSIALATEKLPLKSGEWVPVEVQLRGGKATVKIGGAPAKTYEHASLARPKVNLSVGFAFGSMSVKDFVVTK